MANAVYSGGANSTGSNSRHEAKRKQLTVVVHAIVEILRGGSLDLLHVLNNRGNVEALALGLLRASLQTINKTWERKGENPDTDHKEVRTTARGLRQKEGVGKA